MRVALGLSGGVDSALAARLLLAAGHAVTGVTMRILKPQGRTDGAAGSGEEEGVAAAAALAARLGIPHRVFDCSDAYADEVLAYFRDTYLAGRTPNPCVRCNARVKFGLLPRLAAAGGVAFDRFATGHYARLATGADGRIRLLRGRDARKDQSYFLCRLSQEHLARALFPLGELTKDEVRAAARAAGLAAADRADSQDFCAGGTDELIGRPDCAGDVVDLSGRVLGRHRGYWHYTPGQRRGLGLGGAGAPLYVLAVDARANRVTVGRAEETVRTAFRVEDVNWVSRAAADGPFPCRVKVRSTGSLLDATFDGAVCRVPGGVRGVAPGQSAVCYARDGDELLCGGTIAEGEV